MRVGKGWRQLTHASPARLAWICFGLIVVAEIFDVWLDFNNPAFSRITKAISIGRAPILLYGMAGLLRFADQADRGYAPRHAMWFGLAPILRLFFLFMIAVFFIGGFLHGMLSVPGRLAFQFFL